MSNYSRFSTPTTNKDSDSGLSFSGISCGVRFLFGVQFLYYHNSRKNACLSEILTKIKSQAAYDYNSGKEQVATFSTIVFSDIKDKGGHIFMKFIKNNDLGEVIESPPAINPNTGHTIVTFVWNVDWEKFYPWCQKNGY